MCSTCEGDDWFYAVSTGNCNGPVLTVHSCSWKKKGWFTLCNGHRISLYLCSFPVAWMSVPNQAGSSVSIERTQKMVPCAKCIQFPTWYFGGYPVVSHIHILSQSQSGWWISHGLGESSWIFLAFLRMCVCIFRLSIPPQNMCFFHIINSRSLAKHFQEKNNSKQLRLSPDFFGNYWGPWRWPPSWHEEHSWGSLPLV